MLSFFRFLNKQAIYLDGKISSAQVIKSQNKIIYTVVNVLNICIHWKYSTYPKFKKYEMDN
jgi:hypothetical protein